MYCTKECFAQAVELMDEFGTGLHTHSSESIWEVEESLKRWGRRPIEVFYDRGILGPRTVVAHCVWLSDREIELLAQTDTAVAHCPTSNMKLASGPARIGDLRRAGVRVGIGSDGEKENNNLDLIEEMKVASLLQKVTTLDPTTGDPWDVLGLATSGGAAALGLGDITGRWSRASAPTSSPSRCGACTRRRSCTARCSTSPPISCSRRAATTSATCGSTAAPSCATAEPTTFDVDRVRADAQAAAEELFERRAKVLESS